MDSLYIISGVTGMTGNELARELTSKDNLVVGFDNFFASSLKTVKDILDKDNFLFYNYDINNHGDMEILRNEVLYLKNEYDKLIYINCAAVVHTEHFYHVDRTFETNVLGMKCFLEQAINVGADIYINCSTSEVYSMHSWSDEGVKESDYITLANAEHSQRTSYATGKLLTEFFMKDAVDEGRIKGCSIRFANVYSKNELYPKHIIPHILRQLKEKGEVELLENSKINKRTFLNNKDSCEAIIELINSQKALDGTVYNVATDKNPKIIFKGYRESDPKRRILNTDKIRKLTEWKPKITLDKGIEECIIELNKQGGK